MKILALDCATKTGWAMNCAGGTESGVQAFELRRGNSPGMRFLEFRRWLLDLVRTYQPDVLVYEQAHHRGGATTELCVGMVTRVMEIAAEAGLEYRGVHTATLKSYACGKGNADKAAMIQAAMDRFGPRWTNRALDDNEADALCLLAWAEDGFPEGPGAKGLMAQRPTVTYR